ncbi:MAG: hypothetical protein WCQ52_00520 [Actinomycetes bacterium]
MLHSLIYFVGLPIALFGAITVVVLLSTIDRKKFKTASNITRID